MRLSKNSVYKIYIMLVTFLLITVLIKEEYYKKASIKFRSFLKLQNENTQAKERRFQIFNLYNNIEEIDIIMLGNSLTEEIYWNEFLEQCNVVNRSIGGDTTEDYLKRLDQIINLSPKYVFIMGGINDIYGRVSNKVIVENMETICVKLIENNITPIIQSTIHVSHEAKRSKNVNKRIKELNFSFLKICEEYNLNYIDLNQKLSRNDLLKKEYTYDGIHLNSVGYSLWKQKIKTLIDQL